MISMALSTATVVGGISWKGSGGRTGQLREEIRKKRLSFGQCPKGVGGGTVGQQVCITSKGKTSNFGPKALRKEF